MIVPGAKCQKVEGREVIDGRCPACGVDTYYVDQKCLVYEPRTCDCRLVGYEHIVLAPWHRECFLERRNS
jgi:hypothetical protein